MSTGRTTIERISTSLFLILTPLISLAIPFLPLPVEATPLVMVLVPALLALLLTAMTGGRESLRALLRKPFQWRVGFKWYAIALGLAFGTRLAMSLLALGMGWIPAIRVRPWPPQLFIIFGIMTIFGAVMEELGWRGYLLQRLLAHRPALVSALIIGVPWGVIHLGLLLPGQMNAGAPWLPIILQLIGLSVTITWLFVQTRGNLVIPILYHAGQSYFAFFDEGLTVTQSAWLFTAVTLGLACILILIYGVELQRRPAKKPAMLDAR